mmetsp:Transcript_59317/g.191778  ORF Transcript_59317/g.191778 Transcript_59317/m.191778 type:complete len:375 (-) Transcript_59317:269-1393(-)
MLFANGWEICACADFGRSHTSRPGLAISVSWLFDGNTRHRTTTPCEAACRNLLQSPLPTSTLGPMQNADDAEEISEPAEEEEVIEAPDRPVVSATASNGALATVCRHGGAGGDTSGEARPAKVEVVLCRLLRSRLTLSAPPPLWQQRRQRRRRWQLEHRRPEERRSTPRRQHVPQPLFFVLPHTSSAAVPKWRTWQVGCLRSGRREAQGVAFVEVAAHLQSELQACEESQLEGVQGRRAVGHTYDAPQVHDEVPVPGVHVLVRLERNAHRGNDERAPSPGGDVDIWILGQEPLQVNRAQHRERRAGVGDAAQVPQHLHDCFRRGRRRLQAMEAQEPKRRPPPQAAPAAVPAPAAAEETPAAPLAAQRAGQSTVI